MSPLSAVTTAVERMLLASAVLLAAAIHLGLGVAPPWLVAAIPLGTEVVQLLPAAQILLLAAGLAGLPAPVWVRLAAAPILLAVWAVAWGNAPLAEAGELHFVAAGGLLLVLLLGRCWGMRLDFDRAGATSQAQPQFSIRALLVLTTLIAATLGLLEWLRPTLQAQELSVMLDGLVQARVESSPAAEFLARMTPRTIVAAGALAAAAMAAMVCVLRPGPMWLRLIVTAVLVPLLGAYLSNLIAAETAMGISLAMALTLLAAIVGISVWPLRLAGLRLVRRTGFQPVLSSPIQDRLKTCPTMRQSHEPRTSAA